MFKDNETLSFDVFFLMFSHTDLETQKVELKLLDCCLFIHFEKKYNSAIIFSIIFKILSNYKMDI